MSNNFDENKDCNEQYDINSNCDHEKIVTVKKRIVVAKKKTKNVLVMATTNQMTKRIVVAKMENVIVKMNVIAKIVPCEDENCIIEEKGEDDCNCCNHEHDKSLEYLNLAKQIQADFENFRRHAIEDIKQARLNGQASVIEIFLPCLDTFKEAKKTITDENVIHGVEMIENSINEALKNLGVEKINSIGEKYNPHYHNVIAVMRDDSKDNDVILDEYQAGYKLNDKIIRYAKVIVNKKED